MSLLSELTKIAETLKLPVETGVFSDTSPSEYIVLIPLSDGFAVHADNLPGWEIQEVRVSLFCKGNYLKTKNKLTRLFLNADMVITESRYIECDYDTGYHQYAIDVAKSYEWEE